MNMYITEMTNALNVTNWFYNLLIQNKNEIDSSFSSRLEVMFLLDGGASILVGKIAKLIMIAQMLKVTNHD